MADLQEYHVDYGPLPERPGAQRDRWVAVTLTVVGIVGLVLVLGLALVALIALPAFGSDGSSCGGG